jgi:hypothetical protein
MELGIDSLSLLRHLESNVVSRMDTNYLLYNEFIYGNVEESVTTRFDQEKNERVICFQEGTQAEQFRKRPDEIMGMLQHCIDEGHIFPSYKQQLKQIHAVLVWLRIIGKYYAGSKSETSDLFVGDDKSWFNHHATNHFMSVAVSLEKYTGRSFKNQDGNLLKTLDSMRGWARTSYRGAKNAVNHEPPTRPPQEIYNESTKGDHDIFTFYRGIILDILKNYGHIQPPTTKEIYKQKMKGRGMTLPEYGMFSSVLGIRELVKHCDVVSPGVVEMNHETLRSIPAIAELLHTEYDDRAADWEHLIDFLFAAGSFSIADRTFEQLANDWIHQKSTGFKLMVDYSDVYTLLRTENTIESRPMSAHNFEMLGKLFPNPQIKLEQGVPDASLQVYGTDPPAFRSKYVRTPEGQRFVEGEKEPLRIERSPSEFGGEEGPTLGSRQPRQEPRRVGYRETSQGVELYSEGYGPAVVIIGILATAFIILGRT